MTDSPKIPATKRRKPGGQPDNLNAARSFRSVRDIERRIDGRSLLAKAIRYHVASLLALFGASSLDELDGIERAAIPRLAWRRVVRELSQGRLHAAYEAQDVDAYHAEVIRFQDAVDREERSEARLEVLLLRHRERRGSVVPTLADYLAAKERKTAAEGPTSLAATQLPSGNSELNNEEAKCS